MKTKNICRILKVFVVEKSRFVPSITASKIILCIDHFVFKVNHLLYLSLNAPHLFMELVKDN